MSIIIKNLISLVSSLSIAIDTVLSVIHRL